MKWIIVALLALPFAQANAQAHKAIPAKQAVQTKQNDNISRLASSIPLASGEPYYDTTVEMSDYMTRDKLEQNASTYFEKIFGSGFVNKSGKHKMTGMGKYSFSTNSYADAQEVYNVSYLVDISVKEGRYSVCMHNFAIENQATDVNIGFKLAAAKRNDPKAKLILAYFQQSNTTELKKIYSTMATKPAPALATASR